MSSDQSFTDYGTNQIGVYSTYNNVTVSSQYPNDLTKNDRSPIYVATGDLNTDSFLDIIVSANGNSPTLMILYGDQNGFLKEPVSIDLGCYYATWIAIRDMKGVEKQDITLSSAYSSSVCVLIGDGHFSQSYMHIDNYDSVG